MKARPFREDDGEKRKIIGQGRIMVICRPQT